MVAGTVRSCVLPYICHMNQSVALDKLRGKMKERREREEERFVQFLAQKFKLPVVFLSDVKVSTDALQLVKEVDAREAKMAVYKRLRKVLSIAVREPENQKLKELLSDLEGKGFTCELKLTSTKTLEHLWSFYKDIVTTSATSPGTLTITNTDIEQVMQTIRSTSEVKQILEELQKRSKAERLSQNVEYLVGAAVALNASDIHIEAGRRVGVVRFRIDGVLTDIQELEDSDMKKMLTRMKLLASMKITSKGAQDGGFIIHLSDRIVSVRASVIPEEEGGSMVLRLLDPKNVIHNIDNLGIHPIVLEVFRKNIKKPNGMILTTGPTGSGKTTTLYSFLNERKNKEVKIITLEDPIEYRLEGIVQTQIEKGYTFGTGLRAILRQDPDVVLVGEIRDNEVAEVGIQAALTGHLVFSTLHTNDALGSLTRLEQLNIDPRIFPRAISLIIAQRLVRTLCSHCSVKHNLTEQQIEKVKKLIEELPSGYKEEEVLDIENIKKPGEAAQQCGKCLNGYKGRIGVFEVFEVNDEIEEVYRQRGNIADLQALVKKQNLPFLKDDGLWKVLKGMTSLEEIERVLGVNV